jgi:predicted HAD superfamily Cof-like phosphohydrolase
MSNQDMVREFHEAFGHPVNNTPTTPSHADRALRETLVKEEVYEFCEASEWYDVEGVAKELADVLYVAYGAALVWGIDLDKVFAEVHRSNMSKLGEDGKPVLRDDGKVLKGPNYSEANVLRVLYE